MSKRLCFALSIFLTSFAQPAQAQIQPIELTNVNVFGQDHGFPYGIWTNGSFGDHIQTLGDFDGNGVTDLVIDAFGYTIVLLQADGTVLRMLPGFKYPNMVNVIGPGDMNDDGIPDIAFMRNGEIYVALLNQEGWIFAEYRIGLVVNGGGIGAGYNASNISRVGDVDGDGMPDIGVDLYNPTDVTDRNRRFGVVFIDFDGSVNRKGDQYVEWRKGDWIIGNPDDGKVINVASTVLDLQEAADGIADFLLISSNEQDDILFNYIDFNVDGTANHYLSSETIPSCSATSNYIRVFDEPNASNGNNRVRLLCGGSNYLVELVAGTKEIASWEAQEVMTEGWTRTEDAAQINDLSGDGIREYVAGNSYTFFNEGESAFIQMWSEQDGRGPVIDSFNNGGWKILRPGDQYGSAISVEPWSSISNSSNAFQLMGVRARDDARGSIMWHHLWDDSGVQGSIGTFYQAQTSTYSLSARDLFGSATDVTQGYIGAPGRYGDRGAIFKIPGVVSFAFQAAREADPANTFEVELGDALTAELSENDEFGSSVESFFGDGNPFNLAVGAIEKNKSGGKNTGAVYLLDVVDGVVLNYTELGRDTPMLGAMLDDIDHFGSSIADLGDVDGNGYNDLAVGAKVDDDGGKDRGAVYILFMENGANIKSIQKISQTQGGFHGTLPNSSFFGESVARLGDINDDQIPDLLVGSPRMGKGTAWILTLNSDGTVKTTSLIDESVSEITLDSGALFGGALDANYCEVLIDPTSETQCRPSPQFWIGARGNKEHRGTVWAFDVNFVGDPLPVELTRFEGVNDGAVVKLSWDVASELNNAGFEIERKSAIDASFQRLGFVEGRGTGDTASYSFVDENPPEAKALFYRLKQIDFDGRFEYSDTIELAPILTHETALFSNFPNPFNPVTTISFALPQSQEVSLIVYDIMGREVRTLVDETLPAGLHEYIFEAGDASSGAYIYRLVTPGQIVSRKMMLLK